MAYDIARAQQLGNFANAWQQGIQTARTNQAQDLQLANQQQAAQDQQNLRNLAPGIISGDPDAFAQAAAINPDQAKSYQDARDAQLTRLRGAINYIDTQKTPEAKEAAYQNVRPYLDRIGSTNGMMSPATFAEASPLMERARTQIAMIDMPNNLPAGIQEFNALTSAAGYSPGSADFQKAAQVRLGTSARVVAGGAKTGMITGADGRQRPYIFDPGTQTYSVFDGGQWRPMGQNEASQADSQPIAGGTTQSPQVQSQPSADDRVNNLTSQANQMIRSGVPQDQVDAWITQQASSLPGFSTSQTAPTSGVQGSIAVGRSPEEQAALTEAARQTVNTSFLPTQEAIKSQSAIATDIGKATGKSNIEQQEKLAQSQADARNTIDLLNEAIPLLNKAPSGSLQKGANAIASSFGYSTDWDKAQSQLDAIAGYLTSHVPRMEGPQSDADVRNYNKMAGDLANSDKTVESRIIAAQRLLNMQQKYLENPIESGRVRQQINPSQTQNNYQPIIQPSQNSNQNKDFSHLWGG